LGSAQDLNPVNIKNINYCHTARALINAIDKNTGGEILARAQRVAPKAAQGRAGFQTNLVIVEARGIKFN